MYALVKALAAYTCHGNGRVHMCTYVMAIGVYNDETLVLARAADCKVPAQNKGDVRVTNPDLIVKAHNVTTLDEQVRRAALHASCACVPCFMCMCAGPASLSPG